MMQMAGVLSSAAVSGLQFRMPLESLKRRRRVEKWLCTVGMFHTLLWRSSGKCQRVVSPSPKKFSGVVQGSACHNTVHRCLGWIAVVHSWSASH